MDLKPADVFFYFEALTKIPRLSGQEKNVSNYLVRFANQLGLEVIQDSYFNVIIKKPAQGRFDAPAVILQSHLDMASVLSDGYQFDFEKFGIPTSIEDLWMRGTYTSIGADNGIGIAMMMSLLANPIWPHPPLTCLFTVEKETTMKGAIHLDSAHLKGGVLINLDGNNEGSALVYSAGKQRAAVNFPIRWSKPVQKNLISCELLLDGFSPLNKTLLLSDLLRLLQRFDVSIFKIDNLKKGLIIGITQNPGILPQIEKAVSAYEQKLQSKYMDANLNLNVQFQKTDVVARALSYGTVQRLATFCSSLPNDSIKLGAVKTTETAIQMNWLLKCSESDLGAVSQKLKKIASEANIQFEMMDDYPRWTENPQSAIRKRMAETYQKMYRKELNFIAGPDYMEINHWLKKSPALDLIAIGPTIRNAGTPQEALYIPSVKQVYDFLLHVLKDL